LDWVNAGSGLLQTLIVLSFLYGYEPDVLLLDEPDAHLHVNLQRTLLDFLRRQNPRSDDHRYTRGRVHPPNQATTDLFSHAEWHPACLGYRTGNHRSRRDQQSRHHQFDRPQVDHLCRRESDEECFRGWSEALNADPAFAMLAESMKEVAFVYLAGGSAEVMLAQADRHFRGCKLLSESAQRLMVLDRNDGKWQSRVGHDSSLLVWKKRHVESYLLVPSAWKRAAAQAATQTFELAAAALENIVAAFFHEQSGGAEVDWLNPTQQAFQDIDAKKMLFEARKQTDNYDALAARLYDSPVGGSPVLVGRKDVAAAMKSEEIHEDVKSIFRSIVRCVATR